MSVLFGIRSQNVSCYGGVKETLHFIKIIGLSHYPHKLGVSRLGCHIIRLKKTDRIFQMAAHVIYVKVASLIGNLSGHDYHPSRVCGRAYNAVEIRILGKTANTKAFYYETVISVGHEFDYVAPRAGSKLKKSHVGVEGTVKGRTLAGGALDILQERAVLKVSEDGIINAGKCLKALGIRFAGSCAKNNTAVKDYLYPAPSAAGVCESIGQIALGVGAVKPYGLLCTGEDYRLGAVLYQIAEGGGGVCHGVGTVTDNEAVVAVIVFTNRFGNAQPVLRADVGAVEIIFLQTIYAAHMADVGKKFKELLGVKLGNKPLGGYFGCNGASRTYHQYLLHCNAFRSKGSGYIISLFCRSVKQKKGKLLIFE